MFKTLPDHYTMCMANHSDLLKVIIDPNAPQDARVDALVAFDKLNGTDPDQDLYDFLYETDDGTEMDTIAYELAVDEGLEHLIDLD